MFLLFSNHFDYPWMSVSVPPVITSPVNGTWMHVNESSSLTLTCTGSGIPVPTLTWMHDGAPLPGQKTGSNVIGPAVGSQTLTHPIMSASVSDSAWYTCTASRILKGKQHTAESKVYVNVQGKREHCFSSLCLHR